MTAIGIIGSKGRMGQALVDAIAEAGLDHAGGADQGDDLAALVEQAASRLGDDWDIEIFEMHHRHKVDAPSGTAKLLGQAAARGRSIDLEAHKESGRDGITGARAKGAIGFAALRGGSVAGDHMVILAGDEERIELSHRAENRMIFARGAVKAAQWLVGQKAGRYGMDGVLGF
tara:strand:- start:2383 stop:2901 length:519 start_codon:yes stop_codon:yes gene_type:complete